MTKEFYRENRQILCRDAEPESLILLFSGHAPRKTGDEDYPFYANRNFLYLTGIEQADTVLMLQTGSSGIREKLYLLPANPFLERWNGKRIKEDEASDRSGILTFDNVENFEEDLYRLLYSGDIKQLYLDFDPNFQGDKGNEAFRLAAKLRSETPHIVMESLNPLLRRQRTIKKPCEIETLRKAEAVTKAGIEAMMHASKPGMYEYQYKAEYDYALAQHGVTVPGFPSIISAGKNNFCIHYNGYWGQAKDGDMILNDVGAVWDHEITDVSRAWPCNGKFTERQRLLYECAYRTSEHMFGLLKPGIPMADVDPMIREYNYGQLKEAGVLKTREEISTYLWHGGAHHIGLDVHDTVSVKGRKTEPGMVFCVDVGIYHEEWGIGFRIEDNCLITEDGCENLSRDIPKKIADIEALMGR